jgi:hypothetical protein
MRGEQIWARSAAVSLEELGYTQVYYFKPLSEVNMIVNEKFGGWANITVVIAGAGDIRNCAANSSCVMSDEVNPRGVPIWKVLGFHFWPSEGHVLDGQWVLSPEPYKTGNQYLGYSIEASCQKVPYIQPQARYGSMTKVNALETSGASSEFVVPQTPFDRHRRVGYVLAKALSVFAPVIDKYGKVVQIPAFGKEEFEAVYNQLRVRFEMGSQNNTHASNSDALAFTRDPAMFENHDNLPPDVFPRILSTASVLIGLGSPIV